MKHSSKPPVPTLVTICAVLFAVLIIGGAFWLGRVLGAPGAAQNTSATQAPTVPKQIEGFALQSHAEPSASAVAGKTVTNANFTDGKDSFLLVVSSPEREMEDFLRDGGIVDALSVDESTQCGKSTDFLFTACGRLKDQTGWIIYAETDMPQDRLLKVLNSLPG